MSTSFQSSVFARSLYEAGTPKKRQRAASDPSTPFAVKAGGSPFTLFDSPSGVFEPVTSSPKATYSANRSRENSSSILRNSASQSSLKSSLRGGTRTSLAHKEEVTASPGHASFGTSSFIPSSTPRRETARETPTGQWEHPGLQRIRPANKSLITQRLLINVCVFITVHYSQNIISRIASWISNGDDHVSVFTSWVLSGISFLCVYNTIVAFVQLLKPEDKYEDLPLTPSQRKLLGLPESPSSSAKVSPTPPKYVKSSPNSVSSSFHSSANRISRPSPLSKQQNATQVGNTSSLSFGNDSSILGNVSNVSSVSTSSPLYRYSTKGTGIKGTNVLLNSNASTPNTSARAANLPDTSYTPSGKYLYMADTSPKKNRRM